MPFNPGRSVAATVVQPGPGPQPIQPAPQQQQPPPSGPRTSRRGLLGTAGVAGLVALVVGGGAGLAGAAIGNGVFAEPEPTETTPPPPPPTPTQAGAAGVAAKVLPSTVMIMVESGEGTGSGSGFVLDTEGRIMTNNHVVDSARDGSGRITCIFADGARATAEIVGTSPSYDLGVIQVGTSGLELVPSELGDSEAVEVGDVAVALGAPLGLANTVTQGIISAKNRPVAVGRSTEDASFMNALQTDAPINPGNSGGPLADAEGRIIGVNSAILSNATGETRPGSIGIGFAIPINQAKVISEQLIQTGRATYPTIGVETETAGTREGARIVAIESGSPAAAGGLQEGDVIIKVDGRAVSTMVELIVAIRSHRPGDEVTITFNRSGTPEDLQVTLAEHEG
ncbi:S1C family serine protease [Propionibacteriaceae bacterium Y2011]